VLVALVAGCASARAVSRGYNINTSDLTCEEANRYVQESLGDMNMTITEFRKARTGSPGFAKAHREDTRGGLSGTVEVRCDADGVHILPDESGFSTTRDFERGLFLSLAGRADLVVEREGRYSTGVLHKRQRAAPAGRRETDSGVAGNDATPAAAAAASGVVEVEVEMIRGFATVLDFEANVAAASILPIKVSVTNGSSRAYDFDPRNVALRNRGSREATAPLGAAQAVARLKERVQGGKDGATEELGDVAAAERIIPARELKAMRLLPGATLSGYMYFPDGDYDRARITMSDVATGETEGFLVEF
jgi:hypothetical protein